MSYNDLLKTELNALFARVSPSVFQKTVESAVPQEALPHTEPRPAGWVENADEDTGEATVIIDSRGITIHEGKLYLEDYSGNSVLGPEGYSGAFAEFAALGVYNGSFNAGGTFALTTEVTEVVGDYEASLSRKVPFWVIDTVDPLVNYAGSDIAGDRSVLVQATSNVATEQFSMYQHVPVIAGARHNVFVKWHSLHPATASNFSIGIVMAATWVDVDHDEIGPASWIESESSDTTDFTTVERGWLIGTLDAPEGARFLKLTLRVSFDDNDNTGEWMGAYISRVSVNPQFPIHQLQLGSWDILGLNGHHEIKRDPTYNDRLVMVTGDGFRVASEGVGATGNPVMAISDPTFPAAAYADAMEFYESGQLQINKEARIDLRGDQPQINIDTIGADEYSSIRFKDNGADKYLIDYGSGSPSEDFRIWSTDAGKSVLAMDSLENVYLNQHGRLRFVPIRTIVLNGIATAVSVAKVATGPIAGVPATAKAVSVEWRCSSTTPNIANFVGVYHGTSSALNAGVVFNGSAAGYQNVQSGVISYHPTNGIYYEVNRAAGTITYTLVVTGYWTDDNV